MDLYDVLLQVKAAKCDLKKFKLAKLCLVAALKSYLVFR